MILVRFHHWVSNFSKKNIFASVVGPTQVYILIMCLSCIFKVNNKPAGPRTDSQVFMPVLHKISFDFGKLWVYTKRYDFCHFFAVECPLLSVTKRKLLCEFPLSISQGFRKIKEEAVFYQYMEQISNTYPVNTWSYLESICRYYL